MVLRVPEQGHSDRLPCRDLRRQRRVLRDDPAPFGALATYLPAGESEIYNEPHEFFEGQRIYAEIVEFASKVPQVRYGVYNYEARDAVGTAITQILSGASMDAALSQAEETVRFLMWQ